MRVLMFGWEFPPHRVGGLATATLGLVKGLHAIGTEVTLVVPFPVDEPLVEGLRLRGMGASDGLRVRRLRARLQPYDGLRAVPGTGPRRGALADNAFTPYGENLLDEVERFAEEACIVAAEEPHDVIHVHDWITYAAGQRARAISGRPLVAHIHATEYDRAGDWVNEEIRERERAGMAAADRIIAISHVIRRQVIERYGMAPDKVDVVHWGIDAEDGARARAVRRPFPEPAGTVLFVGRLVRQKGPDLFLEVARRVHDVLPGTRFIMAGSGDLLPHLIERALELGIEEATHFAGGLDASEVSDAYRVADVCVMTSVSEPFGLVALESVRSGTPCIVPRESGVAEVLQNALRADFWDVEDLAAKVLAVLTSVELKSELAERGADEVRSDAFSLERTARKTCEVYARALGIPPAGGDARAGR